MTEGAVYGEVMVDLGVVFRPQFSPASLRPAACAADETGLDELWLWEDCFDHGGVATAAAALAWTTRVRIGVGILPVPLRNPALAAMEIASLAQLFPGRAEIGLGHGVQEWMGQVGARVESPMSLLREHVTVVQRLLAGDTVSFHGRYLHLDDIVLAWVPQTERPRVHIGAVGPKTVALAGELGDGLVLTGGTTPDHLAAQRDRYDAARGDRPGRVTVYLPCVTGVEAAARFEAEPRHWKLDRADDVGVHGDAATIAAAVRRYADAGADAVVLQPPADVDPAEFVRFAGREVGALLR